MDKKITELASLTIPAATDLIEIVDVDSIGLKNKKITVQDLGAYFGVSPISSTASDISFDNTGLNFSSTNVQDALEELNPVNHFEVWLRPDGDDATGELGNQFKPYQTLAGIYTDINNLVINNTYTRLVVNYVQNQTGSIVGININDTGLNTTNRYFDLVFNVVGTNLFTAQATHIDEIKFTSFISATINAGNIYLGSSVVNNYSITNSTVTINANEITVESNLTFTVNGKVTINSKLLKSGLTGVPVVPYFIFQLTPSNLTNHYLKINSDILGCLFNGGVATLTEKFELIINSLKAERVRFNGFNLKTIVNSTIFTYLVNSNDEVSFNSSVLANSIYQFNVNSFTTIKVVLPGFVVSSPSLELIIDTDYVEFNKTTITNSIVNTATTSILGNVKFNDVTFSQISIPFTGFTFDVAAKALYQYCKLPQGVFEFDATDNSVLVNCLFANAYAGVPFEDINSTVSANINTHSLIFNF